MTTDETSVEPQAVGDALDSIQSAATALGVPAETTETAVAVFRRHRDQRAVHAHDAATAAAACLYVACKVERVPRTVDEFVDATGVDRTQLLRRAKAVTSELGIDLSGFADASQYVDRYAGELGLPEGVADRAREIVDHCEDAGIAGGKSPSGWAAAAIYNASVEADMDVRQDTLTELADVTHVTIRNRYKEQREVLRERNPPPATAVEAVDWYRQYLPASEYVADTARDLLTAAGDAHSVDDEPAAWAAAALRVAGERAGAPIGMKALKTPAGCSSSDVHDRAADLEAL
ncbi:transcription initiation factor IIB family protein [Halobacterium sp. CBA1126]|uniref:transcription initiation factor IIB family protein n=1 Tax=Halobacterium sp. CBA1126 TaxID=2668074 RepID=UPI0012FBAAF1|nr:transcription initiation factor IIB family protein [Halobacterium sp. CBA1126]MUV59258.1 transcription initiation factor IIB family protein [Halobacterium sp. CBA1126]